MDISRVKDLLKGYSSLLLPIAIGLAGALLFVPGELMSSKLRKVIESGSLGKASTIQSMTSRVVPRQQHVEEQRYQQLHQSDANQVALLARQTSQRHLLTYELFPEPKSSSVFVFDDFGPRFRGAMAELIEHANAGGCPTKVQLEEAKAGSGSGSRGYFTHGYSKVGATIEDELCRKKAESIRVYANPEDLARYKFWQDYEYTQAESKNAALKDCWYSQLAFWIIEDVFATIETMNTGSDNVFTSPVKRLLNVEFPATSAGSKQRRATWADRNKKDSRPHYLLAVEDALTAPFTRRACNKSIDVVHFEVAVVVGSERILEFMQQLCSAKRHTFSGWDNSIAPPNTFKHNQITVLEYEVVPVNREEAGEKLYRYGKDAVVRLNLTCEYVFDKQGYDAVKPQPIKDEIAGIVEESSSKTPRRPR